MEKPERNQNPKAEQEERENIILRMDHEGIVFRVLNHLRDIKRARAKFDVQPNEAQEREERANAEIERNLERGVILFVAASPDANHDEGRNQRKFVEDIEEKQIERRKRAEDAATHDEKQDVKFLFARLDFPGAKGRREGNDRAHQDEADVQAIHAHVI